MIVLLLSSIALMNPCERAGAQFESTQCAVNDFKRADKELNVQFRSSLARAAKRDQSLATLPSDGRPGYTEVLRGAQRSWLVFRDEHCKVEGYWGRGGTIEPMLVNFCLARVTRERTEQLRKMWRR